MDNSTQMQIRILRDIKAGTCPGYDANSVTYIEYGLHNPISIKQMFDAGALDHAIIYTPNKEVVDEIQALNNDHIQASSNPKDFFGLKPSMVRVDAHVDGKQTDGESVVLTSMKADLLQSRPFLFVRNDNPFQTDTILHIMGALGYQTMFMHDLLKDGTPEKVWVVGIPGAFPIDVNILSDKIRHPLATLAETSTPCIFSTEDSSMTWRVQ